MGLTTTIESVELMDPHNHNCISNKQIYFGVIHACSSFLSQFDSSLTCIRFPTPLGVSLLLFCLLRFTRFGVHFYFCVYAFTCMHVDVLLWLLSCFLFFLSLCFPIGMFFLIYLKQANVYMRVFAHKHGI